MAFNTSVEKAEKVTINLGNQVYESINSLNSIRRIEQAELYTKIAEAENGDDWENIVAIVEQSLDSARRENVPDRNFIEQLEQKLSSVRAKKRAWDLEQEFLKMETDYKGGLSTADDVLAKLETRLITTKEPALVSKIKEQISSMTAARMQDEIELANLKLQNQQNERISLDIYQEDINWAKFRMREAIANNNPLEIERWESLVSQYENNFNAKDIKITDRRFDEEAEKFNWNAIEKVNYYRDIVAKSDATAPIVIDGVQYNSRQAYYQTRYEKYLGTTFAEDFNKHMDDYFKEVISIKGNFGGVPPVALDEFQAAINKMRSMPEMAARQDVLAAVEAKFREGVEQQAQAIFAASLKSEDFEGGLRELEGLQTKYNYDTLQYTNALKDKTVQSKIDAANLVQTRERLAELGLEIPEDLWQRAFSTDVGPTEVAGAGAFQAERFGGFEQLQDRKLLGFGGAELTEAERAAANAPKNIEAKQPATLTDEQKATETPPITTTTEAVTGTPDANVAGQQTASVATEQKVILGEPSVEERMKLDSETSKGLKLPTGETVEDPFFVKDGGFTSNDLDRLRNLVDNSGYANFVPLTGTFLRVLKSYYNRVPGLEAEVEKAVRIHEREKAKNPNYEVRRREGAVSTAGLSGAKIKGLAQSAFSKYNPLPNPEDLPGYVQDIDEYNKNLRKQQGRA